MGCCACVRVREKDFARERVIVSDRDRDGERGEEDCEREPYRDILRHSMRERWREGLCMK